MIAIRTAFILGAGLGMRLRPLTEKCPKPLLPIGGRPIITYAIDHLVEAGIERFIINTHHCPAEYQRAFPDWKWRGRPLILRHEPVLLDTAGGLKNIEDLVAADEQIMVYNGDILTNLPLGVLIDSHMARGAEISLALRSHGPVMNVEVDSANRICDMRDILGRPGSMRCQFTGIYIVNKIFLRRIKKDRIESVVPVIAEMLRVSPGAAMGFIIDGGYWYDIGSVVEYEKVCTKGLG